MTGSHEVRGSNPLRSIPYLVAYFVPAGEAGCGIAGSLTFINLQIASELQ